MGPRTVSPSDQTRHRSPSHPNAKTCPFKPVVGATSQGRRPFGSRVPRMSPYQVPSWSADQTPVSLPRKRHARPRSGRRQPAWRQGRHFTAEPSPLRARTPPSARTPDNGLPPTSCPSSTSYGHPRGALRCLAISSAPSVPQGVHPCMRMHPRMHAVHALLHARSLQPAGWPWFLC